MPRQPEPRWHRNKKRWYAAIGEAGKNGRAKEVFAPETIGAADKAGAWEWFKEEVRRRGDVVVPVDRRTVEWVCEHYLAWCEARVADGELTIGHYRNKAHHLGHLAEAFGPRIAGTLSAETLTTWLRALRSTLSPHYVANIGASVSAAFNWAFTRRLLERNPVAGFTTPTVPQSPERFAERREAAVWLAWLWRRAGADRHARQIVLMQRVLIRTGARPGELCALHWSDIRWDARRTPSGHTAAKLVIPPERWKSGAKTGRPRTIYLTTALTRALRRELGRDGRHERSVFVHGPGRGGIGAGEPWESGSVLSKSILQARRRLIAARGNALARAEQGKPLTPLERGLVAVEIRDDGPNRLTNYRWRHTAASSLLMDGVDVATVAELLGTSVEMISRVYGHLLDQHLAAAVDRPRART